MGKITIHVPQSIQIEYTLRKGDMTHHILDMLNTLLLRNTPKPEKNKDEILGLFADEPELIDQIMEQTMQDRMVSAHLPPSVESVETDIPLRQDFGVSAQSNDEGAERLLRNGPKSEHNKGEWLGLFSDQPELMDQVIDETQKDRERDRLWVVS